MKIFRTGNVVSCPHRGNLYVVSNTSTQKRLWLIPFDSTNSTTHPPDEDSYRNVTEWSDDKGSYVHRKTLMAYGINRYKFEARNIKEYLESQLAEILKLRL